jgi:hypothetical protein
MHVNRKDSTGTVSRWRRIPQQLSADADVYAPSTGILTSVQFTTFQNVQTGLLNAQLAAT